MSSPATVVIVTYRTTELDLSTIPNDLTVLVYENDDTLVNIKADADLSVTRLGDHVNVGFGTAVNRAAKNCSGRLIFVNPDVTLSESQWKKLSALDPDTLGTTSLSTPVGGRTFAVSRYYSPWSLLLTGYRAGRFAKSLPFSFPRVLGGSWSRRQEQETASQYPITSHWASGAVLSIDADRFNAIGGFDDHYFLYLEDTDLCWRLGRTFPHMTIDVVSGAGVHTVSASSGSPGDRRDTDRHYLASVLRYAQQQSGVAWRAVQLALWPRKFWLR